MIGLNRKSSAEALQEEFSRERVDVLASAGNSVLTAIEAMVAKSRLITARRLAVSELPVKPGRKPADEGARRRRIRAETELDNAIAEYNDLREQARLRYYYLLVTREAMGLRDHRWIEALYRVPDKIKPLNHETSPASAE